MELQKLVSFKSVGFVFLSITVVLIISFLHYLEIKRVLKNRKIIWFEYIKDVIKIIVCVYYLSSAYGVYGLCEEPNAFKDLLILLL